MLFQSVVVNKFWHYWTAFSDLILQAPNWLSLALFWDDPRASPRRDTAPLDDSLFDGIRPLSARCDRWRIALLLSGWKWRLGVIWGFSSLFYSISGQFGEVKKASLGTQPPSLHRFRTHGSIHVFACSDRLDLLVSRIIVGFLVPMTEYS